MYCNINVDEVFTIFQYLKQVKIVILFVLTINDILVGFYTPCSNSQVSSHLTLLTESLPTDPTDEQQAKTNHGNRNKCSVPGILYNTNTLEGYHALDKQALLKAEAKKVFCYSI